MTLGVTETSSGMTDAHRRLVMMPFVEKESLIFTGSTGSGSTTKAVVESSSQGSMAAGHATAVCPLPLASNSSGTTEYSSLALVVDQGTGVIYQYKFVRVKVKRNTKAEGSLSSHQWVYVYA